MAERYGALVMVDDSHATGFIGARGRGSHEFRGVMGRIDILTGTLGKALGGASGGFVAARKEIVGMAAAAFAALFVFEQHRAGGGGRHHPGIAICWRVSPQLRDRLHANARYFRERMQALGFDLIPGEHPIIPVMLGDAPLAVRLAERMQQEGIYVVAFSFPVVPHGKAQNSHPNECCAQHCSNSIK